MSKTTFLLCRIALIIAGCFLVAWSSLNENYIVLPIWVAVGTSLLLFLRGGVKEVMKDERGNVLWAPNGIPLETHKSAGFPYNPLIVSDGASGAIVLWGGPMGMYAQKIDADSNMEWQPGGKLLSSSGPQRAVSDGSGGAIFTFGRIRAQRIDADGRTIWSGDGTGVTEHGTHAISSDGQGGAVIAWGIGKDMFSSEKSYVQRISADGKLLWGEEGIRLNP